MENRNEIMKEVFGQLDGIANIIQELDIKPTATNMQILLAIINTTNSIKQLLQKDMAAHLDDTAEQEPQIELVPEDEPGELREDESK